jgi:UTP--glucose-1-phosphate uridylyltransferase
LLEEMLRVQAAKGGSVIALMEVPEEMVSMYGVATVSPADANGPYPVVRVSDLVEKPPLDEAPSNLAVIGRYVLSPTIFSVLRETPPGRGNEIQLTDGLKTLAAGDDEPVHGVVFTGRRYDTGDRADYVKAVVRLACERPDIGPELQGWLKEFVAGL